MEMPTPETDAKAITPWTSEEMMATSVPADFARKLERERDEARARVAELTGRLECQTQAAAMGCHGFSPSLPTGDHLAT
jgi:hypothetical protein